MHFFLHGGRTGIDSEKNKKFFQTLCSYGSKILIFPFGGESEAYDFKKYKKAFLTYNSNKILAITCADHNITKLIEQITDNEIVFLGGGSVRKHLAVLNNISNLSALLEKKIVVGVSAGAIVRGRAYYSSIKDSLGDGIGLLPIKIMAHYGNNNPGLPNKERSRLLDEYGEQLPIVKIPEQEYREFRI